MSSNKVYILNIKRTAVGSFLGALATLSPSELGVPVVKHLLEEAQLPENSIDEVIVGNILSAGHGQNVARQISVNAGVGEQVPAYALNMLCGSGLKAIYDAYTKIKAGEADCVIAGGVESMSDARFVSQSGVRQGNKMGSLTFEDTLLKDGLTDAFNNYHMGITAENLAEKYSISREEQDEFAIHSQEKARKAQESGRLQDEIIPLTVKTRKGETVVDKDEYINYGTTLEKLAGLRTAFKKDGTVTAGNASGLNDGAAFALVVSEKFVKEHNLSPMVEIKSFGQSGVDPAIMGIGPVDAIAKSLDKAGLSIEDLDLIELNEAFAAQSIAVIKQLVENHQVDHDKLVEKINVNGGAIAIGHPLGASGARVASTLIHEMKKQDSKYGCASLCIGGGMGIAMVVENLK